MFGAFLSHSRHRSTLGLVSMGLVTFAGLAAVDGNRALAQARRFPPVTSPDQDAGFLPPGVAARPAINPVSRPDVLDLEPAVAQAELILAVRLVDVTETKIVHGGR